MKELIEDDNICSLFELQQDEIGYLCPTVKEYLTIRDCFVIDSEAFIRKWESNCGREILFQ